MDGWIDVTITHHRSINTFYCFVLVSEPLESCPLWMCVMIAVPSIAHTLTSLILLDAKLCSIMLWVPYARCDRTL